MDFSFGYQRVLRGNLFTVRTMKKRKEHAWPLGIITCGMGVIAAGHTPYQEWVQATVVE